MRGYKTKEDKLREASVEQKNVQKRTEKYSTKEVKAFILVIFILILGACVIIIIHNHKVVEKHPDYEYADSDSIATDSVAEVIALADSVADETVITNDDNEESIDNGGAPLSTGEIEDGKGGYDDNAEGYFSMYADKYITENHDVYFDGRFSDSKGTYPIMLKFELDDNWHAGVCYYYNVDYGTQLKMRVRFTEEKMIIRGNADGCDFIMKFTPTDDGRWSGTAQNGNHHLNAFIKPVNR